MKAMEAYRMGHRWILSGSSEEIIWRINMLNTAILMGRLTSDPELRYTPNNTAVTSFTLAVERSYVKIGHRPPKWISST